MSGDQSRVKDANDQDAFGRPRIPYRGYYDKKHCDDRRKWVERFTFCSLEQCGQWWLNEGSNTSCSCISLKGNIENPIGLAKVPLAVCGPLLFKGENLYGYSLCPFATTEGALVASMTRGATAITRAGGVYAKVFEQTQIRSPYFRLRSIKEVDILAKWIGDQFSDIKDRVHLHSQHALLKKVYVTRHDRVAVLHFEYSTGNACGQNMVTSVTSHLCKWLLPRIKEELPQIEVLHYCIESGLSGDKSISFQNLWRTRGYHVQAEAWIPENILKSVLKVDIKTFMICYEEWQHLLNGAGKIGFGTNVANVVTGVFIATGQDVASVESSHANLSISSLTPEEMSSVFGSVESKCPGLHVSISIPSLNVGTVGGGTGLATQKECLDLIDCHGTNGPLRLCEIIAGFSLSLEISTFAALASGQFASAHEKLGRNHPTLGIRDEHLNKEFFSKVVGGELLRVIPFNVDTGNSILSEITKTEMSKKVGHFGFTLDYRNHEGCEETIQVVVKSKTSAIETCNMLNRMAQACGLDLAMQYQKYKMLLGFNHCDVREVNMYNLENRILKQFFPTIHSTVLQPTNNIYVIVMEYLTSEKYTHLSTVNNIEEWSLNDIKVVLRDLACLHSVYLNKTAELESYEWLDKRKDEYDAEMSILWSELLKHAHYEFPRMWTEQRVKIMESAIKSIDKINGVLATAPLTLIHNDCNPRNMCLHKLVMDDKETSTQRMCLYDWELAKLDVPQRDLAEFLTFTLSPASTITTRLELMNYYRCYLEQYSGVKYPMDRFIDVFNAAMFDFAIRRMLMYTMVHTFKDYKYLPRVVDSLFTYIETVKCFYINSRL